MKNVVYIQQNCIQLQKNEIMNFEGKWVEEKNIMSEIT